MSNWLTHSATNIVRVDEGDSHSLSFEYVATHDGVLPPPAEGWACSLTFPFSVSAVVNSVNHLDVTDVYISGVTTSVDITVSFAYSGAVDPGQYVSIDLFDGTFPNGRVVDIVPLSSSAYNAPVVTLVGEVVSGLSVRYKVTTTDADIGDVVCDRIVHISDGTELAVSEGSWSTHTFAASDTYTAYATALDSHSLVGVSDVVALFVNRAPTVVLTQDSLYGYVLRCHAAASDPDPDDTIASLTINYGDTHTVSTTAGAIVSHTYAAEGTYHVQATATDNHGATGSSNILTVVVPGPSAPAPGPPAEPVLPPGPPPLPPTPPSLPGPPPVPDPPTPPSPAPTPPASPGPPYMPTLYPLPSPTRLLYRFRYRGPKESSKWNRFLLSSSTDCEQMDSYRRLLEQEVNRVFALQLVSLTGITRVLSARLAEYRLAQGQEL